VKVVFGLTHVNFVDFFLHLVIHLVQGDTPYKLYKSRSTNTVRLFFYWCISYLIEKHCHFAICEARTYAISCSWWPGMFTDVFNLLRYKYRYRLEVQKRSETYNLHLANKYGGLKILLEILYCHSYSAQECPVFAYFLFYFFSCRCVVNGVQFSCRPKCAQPFDGRSRLTPVSL